MKVLISLKNKSTFILQGNVSSHSFSYLLNAIIDKNEILMRSIPDIKKLIIIEGLTLSEGLIGYTISASTWCNIKAKMAEPNIWGPFVNSNAFKSLKGV